jgi:hypothetical protein
MPFVQRVKKTPATITLTPEGWAILQHKAKQAGMSKSEYIENLVRRGDTGLYDAVIKFLSDYYQKNGEGLQALEEISQDLKTKQKTIREFLVQIGISPNFSCPCYVVSVGLPRGYKKC